MTNPVILCGLGKVGRRVFDCLHTDGVPVIVINLAPVSDLPAGIPVIVGDSRVPAVLEQAGVLTARGVIVCTSDDLVNISTALAARQVSPNIRVVVRAFNPKLVPKLGHAVANVMALSVSGLAAPLVSLIARTGSALGTVTTADGERPVVEITVSQDSPVAGKTPAELREQVSVLARFSPSVAPRFLNEVPPDEPIQSGDRVVVCGSPANLLQLDQHGFDDEDVRWAGGLRRGWRVVSRIFSEVDLPVKVCFTILIGVIVAGSIVFSASDGDSIASGFYHTVSLMATAGDMHADTRSGPMKMFVGGLRLVGAALFACFTAILTNYLVRARLGGALDFRRIPDGGHVVVCGLGNVGFRVVEELLRAGLSVVVVEPARDGRFLASARRLGAAIVNGDATVAEALRQARVDTARAVVAATNNDLVNVEIALSVRELSAIQRVVVRLSDGELAKTLRDTANVRFAISLPNLAAPAFVAALYGDRIQAVFLVGGRLLAAVDLTIEPGEAGLEGLTIRDAASSFGLIPVALVTRDRQQPVNILDHKLSDGDQLTVIAGLGDIDRIYRRDRADSITASAAAAH